MNYKKLIQDNEGKFEDSDILLDFVQNYSNHDIKELEEYTSEYADSITPIYYHDIEEEWQKYKGRCRGLAFETFGETSGDADDLMQKDLYCMYYNDLYSDYNILIELIN